MLVLKSWVLLARYAAKRPQGNGDKGYKLIRKIKAVAYDGRPPILLTHKKALLSISDGRASSFFNTFIKIITPQPFLRAADFRVQRYEEKPRNSEKIRENQRKTENLRENRRKSEKIGEFKRKSEKIRENRRKSEKIGGLSGNFRAYPQELSVNQCSYP